MLAELEAPLSSADLTGGAQQNLPAKHLLAAADAALVDAAFRTKLAALGDEPIQDPHQAAQNLAGTLTPPAPAEPEVKGHRHGRVAARTIRLRDRDRRKFVSTQPCLVCGRSPTEAHHLRFAQPRALSRKVSDEFTVPLCRVHHRELHRHGAEAAWWQSIKIDPLPVAHRLWQHARRDGTTVAVDGVTEPKSSIAANGAGTGSLAPKSDPAGEPRPDGRAIT